ncbi:RNA-directed DNA polymerase [Nodosilinea sp. LEGE 07298]|uniref:RNA-directed DNA polymerase n=1 Tax=Nodosilinea sp. LEGE 07298 TaxID=2777970 RepID=UPI001882FB54|nr:RNA-directed DNA polymerase [Nodosilinea sp. LEGE 07298]MBE9109026.1 RNA-directed DNA polymerase [Nodosilinea sp. LEGE 07298]
MTEQTHIRNLLLNKGFFPEVLPPCFDSENLAASFQGKTQDIEARKFHNRAADYIRYSGTKHDGHRRAYGTVNPIPYFNACQFIFSNWEIFETKFKSSKLSLDKVRLGRGTEDRAIIVPTLSELTNRISSQIRFSPYILKADIAQFFPSIYTHAVSWVAHGRDVAKANLKHNSTTATFNAFDWFTQQCQSGQTRGVTVGPDAFRIFAEFISCEIDNQLLERINNIDPNIIIGGVRHVDDFYIGVRSEVDAAVVLSVLRDILQTYELQINDTKTKVISGLEAFDDVWAQELRAISLESWSGKYSYAIDKAHEVAKSVKSQSPIKLILRRLDTAKCYRSDLWESIEAMLQRVLWHYEHCTDYVCLLLTKRVAIQQSFDRSGWSETVAMLIKRHLAFNQHHEIAWLLWTALVCNLHLDEDLISQVSKMQNSHLRALIIAAYGKGKLNKKPPITLGRSLSTSDSNWLHNLVGKSLDYSKAKFSGDFADEFEHLAEKEVELINFDKHMTSVSQFNKAAISSSKYGYDAQQEADEDEHAIPF